jgi:hypothetical protein
MCNKDAWVLEKIRNYIVVILGDIVLLCISCHKRVTLNDKHNHKDLIYIYRSFTQRYYMFRLSASAIIRVVNNS